MTHYQAQRRSDIKNPPSNVPVVQWPKDMGEKMALAKTTEDWQKIAAIIAPVMQSILDGQVKATASQVSLMKDVLNRAYGRAVATQSEKKVAAGIVLLPTLNTGEFTTICPNCGFDAMKPLAKDVVKERALKALTEF